MFAISVRLNRSQTLATEILLENLGAVSISLEDAEDNAIFVEQVGSTPLWQHITLTALFTQDVDLVALQNRLEKSLNSAVEIGKQEVKEQDWQKNWGQSLQAMCFGERMWICPSNMTYPDPFAINIRLDPGLAFGTGSHETTSLCLEWLTNYSLQNKTIMDFGCGSGILAIAAYFLGAKTVYALDHDPQAIQAAQMNAANNRVCFDSLKISLTSSPKQCCDIIIANVLLRPLIELCEHFAECVSPTGKLILSGILEHQLVKLEKSYQTYFTFDVIHSKNEWLLIEASPT